MCPQGNYPKSKVQIRMDLGSTNLTLYPPEVSDPPTGNNPPPDNTCDASKGSYKKREKIDSKIVSIPE